MEDEAKIIKRVDADLRKFIGGSDREIERIFSDSEAYRRMADRFWKREVVKAA
jgi:hypothetical protein